ncbi:MAG: bifunctional riboflavin kinase/FAD synthetase [Traorella sp.]
MKVVHLDFKNIYQFEALSACIGYFDGLHLGHLKLIETSIFEAKRKHIKSAMITFDPDPWCVIKNQKDIPHLTSMEERIQIVSQLPIDYFIILPFTKELCQMSTFEFENMLRNLNIKSLVCGFDYTYGYQGKGNVETLKRQSYFDVIEVEAVTYQGKKISSTRIEQNIINGQLEDIKNLLGRYYSIHGIISSGRNVGTQIGFPTANLKPTYLPIIPKNGVYIGYASVDHKQYRCMMNIGHNPTFNYQEKVSIETYLLDFNKMIYGHEMDLIFIKRIRDEKKFASVEELIYQLKKDEEEVKKLDMKI